jgi:hypothetical protein
MNAEKEIQLIHILKHCDDDLFQYIKQKLIFSPLLPELIDTIRFEMERREKIKCRKPLRKDVETQSLYPCHSKIMATDLGHQYVAWALWDEECGSIDYGIYSFGSDKRCESRVQGVCDFINSFPDNIDVIIIERQMHQNRRAVEIQFALATAARMRGIKVIFQHPIDKFKILGYECITEHKQHKRLSETIALEWLNTVNDVSKKHLNEYDKMDDCADAINEIRTYLLIK